MDLLHPAQNNLFYHSRKMLVFQLVDFLRKGFGGVGGRNLAGGLENGGALVVVLVDKMYGNAALCFASGYYSLVHAFAVHAFATKFGQQRRMYVDDTPRESREQILRHKPNQAILSET